MILKVARPHYQNIVLGLDPGQYKASRVHEDQEELGGLGLRDEDRFLSCQKLQLTCACGEELILESPLKVT